MNGAHSGGIGYRPEIDGLRALAVLSVIFYHAGIPWLGGGYVGVDIFFVISGFLITSIISREISAGKFSFAGFYERRIRRIIPALLFVCISTIPLAWLVLSPEQLKDFGQSLVATMAFAANLYFYLTNGYFSPDVETLPMIHMWSLAVEEQFYLAFPVFLLVLYRVKKNTISAMVLAFLAISLALCLWNEGRNPASNFYLAQYRAWELLTGAWIALNARRLDVFLDMRVKLRITGQLLGAVLVVATIVMIDAETSFPGKYAIPPVLGTVLLLMTLGHGGPVDRLLSLRPVVFVGLISYSAYLWHQPLFAIARVYSGAQLAVVVKAGLIGATLFMAWLSWRFVEQPFRNRHFLTRSKIFVAAAAGSTMVIAIGTLLHVQAGFPGRFNVEIRQLAASMQMSPERERCHGEGANFIKPDKACRYFKGTPTWAVFGDSHAIELGRALAERLRPQDEAVVHLTFSGCPPALEFDSPNPGCSAWTKETTNWLVGQPDLKNVLLVYRHSFHLYGDQTKIYPQASTNHPAFLPQKSAAKARNDYWQSFLTLINRLTSAGKHVYVVAPIPELPSHVERYVYGHNRDLIKQGSPAAWNLRRGSYFRSRMGTLSKMSEVTVIDPFDDLCSGGICHMVDKGKMLYFDDNHLSMAGGRLVINGAIDRGLLPIKAEQ
jgi:peptidoglycan/LPS O-acetylase OafA/YrhL